MHMNDHRASTFYESALLIKHLLDTPRVIAPQQEIVSGSQLRYTYQDYFQRLASLCSGLESLGIKAGDTVAVMDWDCHRYFECFFGIPMMGAVLHTVNVRLSPEQILYTINHAEDDVIMVHTDFIPLFEKIRDRIERPVKLILLSDARDVQLPAGFVAEYESLLDAAATEYEFRDFDERTRATTFYTTGTTGDPKGVAYSHRQLVLHTLGVLAAFGPVAGPCRFHDEDVYMPITPMFHVHGWGFPFAATLAGVKQVYPGRYEPAALLKLIELEGVTFSHCVPTILHMLLSAPEAANTDLSGWKVIIGGSALPEGLARTALDRGIEVFSAYGMSETCPVLSVAQVTTPVTELGGDPERIEATLAERCKTGRPVPMVDLHIVDPDMQEVAHDGKAAGEVVTRAPWLTEGYLKNPEGSEALWQGGYLHTGDVGTMDEAGSLQVTDRIKDVIKSGGEWISSIDLENVASTCPGVGECAAIGVPDERWGERPLLLIVPGSDATKEATDHAELQTSVRDAIEREISNGVFSKWAMPSTILVVDEIEKTSVGKLNKKELRTKYAAS